MRRRGFVAQSVSVMPHRREAEKLKLERRSKDWTIVSRHPDDGPSDEASAAFCLREQQHVESLNWVVSPLLTLRRLLLHRRSSSPTQLFIGRRSPTVWTLCCAYCSVTPPSFLSWRTEFVCDIAVCFFSFNYHFLIFILFGIEHTS